MDRATQAQRAMRIAQLAHQGQTYNGMPYYEGHVDQVVRNLHILRGYFSSANDYDNYLLSVAYLHDVLEDTSINAFDLRAFGVAEPIIEGVKDLTRRKIDSYAEYIRRVKGSPVVLVKVADLFTNLSNCPPEGLDKRYFKALRTLGFWEEWVKFNSELD